MNKEACNNAPAPSPLILCLPLMHPESASSNQGAPSTTPMPLLWPGHAVCPPTHWQPHNYAFSAAEATACLNDMQAMSEAALTGVPLQALAASENKRETAKALDEQKALRSFCNEGALPEAARAETELTRKAAQKALLWAWLLEERYHEVRALVHRFQQGADQLMHGLGVEEDQALSGLSALETMLGDDPGLLPPWKLVLENAALFLPEESVLVVNHPGMAADMREHENFAPVNTELAHTLQLPASVSPQWSQAHMPLWQVLNLASAPAQRPWLTKCMTVLLPPAEFMA